jgi:two-component system, OmpR family, phosphate regulon sensor histidine kinase PhoR
MKGFRKRILITLVSLVLIALVCLGLLLGELFKDYYIHSFDERLKKESELLAGSIENGGGVKSINKDQVKYYSEMLDVRVTVVDSSGMLIYDSIHAAGADASHKKNLEELIERSSGGTSLEISGDQNLHYYWRPIYQDGKKEGYVFLSTKMEEINDAYRQIWWLLISLLSISFIFILLLGWRITAHYTKPIELATKKAIELAKGNYRLQTLEEPVEETGMLNAAINVLARNLRDLQKAQEMQQDRMSALIENMGSGLILIDSKGYIQVLNKAYKEFFQLDPVEYLNKLYYKVIEHKEIIRLIEHIFMIEKKVKKEIVLPFNIGRRHFEVYGVPIIGTNDVWKGVLLVVHDITDIKRLEQVRKDFVANVSHELKTPITSIKGFSETLLDGAMNDKDALTAFLNIILKESDRLQTLTQDLLDLSKIEKQGFSLDIQEVNIPASIKEVMKIVQKDADEKGINMTFESKSDSVMAEGDPNRLKQVFLNLISNAITYTQNGGSISISLKETDVNVTINFTDTGIGINKDEIHRIFERFYRIDKARSRNSGGTGLGLAIVKHLVDAHKGKITVKSKEGQGTTFIVELNKKIPLRT